MSIYLVRHGQTDGNKNRILQTPDTPLSDLGLGQAEQLAKHLAPLNIKRILCSDHLRTQQTAAAITNLQPTALTLEPLLRERSFGDLRGRSYDDIAVDFFHPEYAPPNGETQQQFSQRMHKAWEMILTIHQQVTGSLVVMTHGLVLRQLIKQHLIIPSEILMLSDFRNTCITEVDAKDKKTVLRLCDARHLKENTAVGAAV